MTQTEALKLALEALKRVLPHAKESMTNPELDIDILDAHAAITAIEARLSPQNELEAHWNEVRASYGARQAALEAKDEPVSVKRMMGWVEGLKRQSDNGKYLHIPSGLNSGMCWELANELEQFINTTPPQPVIDESAAKRIATALGWEPKRKPLTDEEIWDEVKAADLDWQTGWSLDEDASNRYITFARAIEAAHGIIGEQK